MIAARCALLALLAVLGSCKTSSSATHGSRIVLNLGMTLAEVKAYCPDTFDVMPRADANNLYSSPRVLRTLVLRGFGQNIELHDSEVSFAMHNGRVGSLSANGLIGVGDRSSAESFFNQFYGIIMPEGWFLLREDSPHRRTYARDEHGAVVTMELIEITDTSAAKFRNLTGERWLIDLSVAEVPDGR